VIVEWYIAHIVIVERYKRKVGQRENVVPSALRGTMIFRPEEGVWKIVHRHADWITTAQPAQAMTRE